MRALVVYESMFGNNHTIARAIADGLAPSVDVEVVEVGVAPASLPADLDLLVVGGPNHQFGMSRRSTRLEARKEADGPWVSPDIGLREWLETLEPVAAPVRFAAFDTRIDNAVLRRIDRTAKTAARRLGGHGLRELSPAASFCVQDLKGPLVDGEVERALAWGAALAQALQAVPA